MALYTRIGQDPTPQDGIIITKSSPGRRLLISLIITNAVSLVIIIWILNSRFDNKGSIFVPSDFAITEDFPTIYKSFTWWTEYSGANETEVDALWDAIQPSHGLVAVDRVWSQEQNWPDSLHLPTDDSKNIYLLEAYHQLHCVKIIRQTFWEAVKRQPYTYNPPHSGHCFDFLRQSIQCNADNTPLYSFGDLTAGDGQLRKCKDWSALRDWATKNTACYRDTIELIPLADHFGYCDDGADGLP